MSLRKLINIILFCWFILTPLQSAELTEQERQKIEQAVPAKATVKPKKARKLLVTNFVYVKDKPGYGHTSIAHGNLALALMGQKTGAYEMVLNNDTLQFRPENLQQFDAVCFNNTTGVLFTDPELRKSLLDFIKSGKGFIGFHAAGATMCQYPRYDYWPEFGEMLGGFEDGGHPWSAEEYMQIKLDDPGHPLNAAFGGQGFKIRDEAFQFRHGYTRENLHILLAIDASDEDFQRRRILPERMKDRDLAVSWIRNYGEGRVFYCFLGHNPETFSNPAILQHFLDGIQFALGDYDVDAAPSMKSRAIENILDELKTYEYGNSRLPLTHLSDLIRQALGFPEQAGKIEKHLLDFVQSQATLPAKEYVCRELRIIGSEQAVPVLGEMLTHEKTSAMALYALLAMPYETVDDVLMAALPKTTGRTKIGIINALAQRRCEQAVSVLKMLIFDTDQEIASSAGFALGEIGGREAAASLEMAKEKTIEPLRGKILDAYVRCADQLLAAGETQSAITIYRGMSAVDEPELIRIAAFRGLIAADKDGAENMVVEVLTAKDEVLRNQVIAMAREIPGKKLTTTMTALLPKLDESGQIQTLSVLADRGDAAALPAIIALLDDERQPVRIAAIEGLGKLGDASVVLLLAEKAASAAGAEKKAARETLCRLQGAAVDQAILDHLTHAAAEVKVELIRCTRDRGMAQANQILMQTAQDPEQNVRMESLKSLTVLADKDDIPALVDLLIRIENESERNLVITAISATAKKINGEKGQSDTIADRFASAEDAQVKAALVTAMGSIGDERYLPVVIKAYDSTDEEIKQCAVRALANWPRPNADLMEKLYQIAQTSSNPVYKTLALRGYITLIGFENYYSDEEALQCYRMALDLHPDIQEKRLLLSGLSRIASLASLQLAVNALDDTPLQQEAVNAVMAIAQGTKNRYTQETRALLEKAVKIVQDDQLRQKMEQLMP